MLGCLLVLAACTTPPVPAPEGSSPTGRVEQPADPMPPLRGEEPTGPSGLTLLIGDTLIDVDAGTRHRVTDRTGESFEPLAVGADAVLSGFCPECGPHAGVYALPRAATTATVIGTGNQVAPAPDGVWVKRFHTAESCTLAKIDLAGATVVPSRDIPCDVLVRAETPLGLLARVESAEGREKDQILAVADLRPVVRAARIHAVVDRRVLSSDDNGFLLTGDDTRTPIPAPTSIGHPSDGRVSPDRRHVAISFEHPAWPGPRQRLDVWLLDLTTLDWAHVPSMPVPAALKGTAEAWAPDGRLVLAGQFHDLGQRVAWWRPGENHLTISHLPAGTTTGSLVVR